jgi:hypothetical protein
MVRSPETLVARLRNRKGRIVTYAILSVVLAGLTAMHWIMAARMIASLVPEEGKDLLFHVVVGQPIIVGIAFMQTAGLLMVAGFGATVGALITELTMFTKTDMLVRLWDRVQVLEQSALPLANGQHPQDRPSAGG